MIESIFALGKDVRYVATYIRGELSLNTRDDLQGASDSGTDKFEELLVNPTVLTLVSQRGNIDCGGLDYVLIRYGNFFQFVKAVPGGHVSVALEANADVVALSKRICDVVAA